MSERYQPNGTPLTPYEQELLTILMEECAEVIVAASKLKRFGKENRPNPDNPDLPVSNTIELSKEVGDLYSVLQHAQSVALFDPMIVRSAISRKNERLAYFMQETK